MDLSFAALSAPAPGRRVVPLPHLGPESALIALDIAPGVVVAGLFVGGEIVEIWDGDEDEGET